MKKFLTLAAYALLAVALPLSLASCGGDDDDKDKTEKPTDTKAKTPTTTAEAQKMLWGAWEREEALIGDEDFDRHIVMWSEVKYFGINHVRAESKRYAKYAGQWVQDRKGYVLIGVELIQTDPSCTVQVDFQNSGTLPYYLYNFTSQSYETSNIHWKKLDAAPEYVDLSVE